MIRQVQIERNRHTHQEGCCNQGVVNLGPEQHTASDQNGTGQRVPLLSQVQRKNRHTHTHTSRGVLQSGECNPRGPEQHTVHSVTHTAESVGLAAEQLPSTRAVLTETPALRSWPVHGQPVAIKATPSAQMTPMQAHACGERHTALELVGTDRTRSLIVAARMACLVPVSQHPDMLIMQWSHSTALCTQHSTCHTARHSMAQHTC